MSEPDQTSTCITVVTGKLHRARKGHSKTFVQTPPLAPAPVHRPARVAIMLALAHKIQQAIDRGAVRDRAEVARKLGLTRARVTQLLDLTLLAPNLQNQLLELETGDSLEPICEATIRAVTAACLWTEQRTSYENVCLRRSATETDSVLYPAR